MPILLSMLAPVLAFQDLAALDHAAETATGATTGTPGGLAQPLDPRIRLPACPGAPMITADAVNVIFACPAKGWRFAAPRAGAGVIAQVPFAVARGDTVTVTLRGAGFVLKRSATAVTGGAVGTRISVRFDRNASPIGGTIAGPGEVFVDRP